MTPISHPGIEPLLTPAETAAALRVDVKTLARWAKAGKIRFLTTPGGHRRFFASDIQAIIEGKS